MKQKYIVYFELYGKKMKTSVIAESETDAQNQIKDKIIFHKTTSEIDSLQDVLDSMQNIFDVFNGKK